MKKRLLISFMAFIMCFALAACDKEDDNPVDTNSEPETTGTVADASKSNYKTILIERFGIDAKNLEEEDYVLQDVRGTENPYSFQITLTYSTKHEDSFKEQSAMKARIFDVLKAVGGGVIYQADEKGYITDKTFKEFEAYKEEAYDSNQWYYKWDLNDYKVYCTTGSTLWIQISCSKK